MSASARPRDPIHEPRRNDLLRVRCGDQVEVLDLDESEVQPMVRYRLFRGGIYAGIHTVTLAGWQEWMEHALVRVELFGGMRRG